MRTIFRILLYIAGIIAVIDIFTAVVQGTDPYISKLFQDLFFLFTGSLGIALLLIRDIAHLRIDLALWDIQQFLTLVLIYFLKTVNNLFDVVMAIFKMPFSLFASLLDRFGIDSSPDLDFGGAGIITFDIEELSFLADLNIVVLGQYVDFKVCVFPSATLFHNHQMDALSVGFYYFSSPLGLDVTNTIVISFGGFLRNMINSLASSLGSQGLEDFVKEIFRRL